MAPILPVMGQIGSQIDTVLPESATGVVGSLVNVLGSIDTTNGQYKLFFGSVLVVTANAVGSSVSSGFFLPEIPAGTYTITLQDVTKNSNATHDFTVNTNYVVQPSLPSAPAQLQEGNSVSLNVTVTGGQASTAYSANITVTLPAPLSTNYSRLITLPTSSSKGSTNTQVTFPDSAFEPSGGITDYAGTYQVYFNQSVAVAQFTVGFTDLSQYHRGQTAKINGIGYKPNDTATVTVKSVDTGVTLNSTDVTPTSAGVVVAQWLVPSNAAIGAYTVTITARNTAKAVPDVENITVPGNPITIRVTDLSGRPVRDVVVEALDAVTNKTYDATSDASGNATLSLESGKATLTAYWNGLQAGQTSITVTGAGSFDLQCELTDLKITVKDKNGLLIPSVNLDISYSYFTTKDNQSKSGSASGKTDVSGVFSLNSTPPSIGYAINASVYGQVFNGGNSTVDNLPVKAVSEVTIICPYRTLTFNVVDYYGNSIPNARLSMLEVNAGIFYSGTTNDDGSVTVQATFGRYMARVYTSSVLLNETQVDAFSDKQVNVQCFTYNLQVNVKIVDYFGQAIPSANVRLTGADGKVQSQVAQSDGTAAFSGVIGGNVQITAYLSESDDYYEAANVYVGSPTTVQVQMGRYVELGGIVVQTSLFITLMIVLPTIVAFVVFEVFMRRRGKPKKPAAKVEKSVSK